ncbi:hypothetical protein ARALYDRAFT_317013 [Arabidopsis lyrata subsp. lyrata]|uniref:Ribosome-recycling factor, chloroplastic n=1 Tax=Arabidopsis lyrata subsp. lyrata TaxID=81972 RepID=D7L9L2_ARALL|nr:hypothetical protein ARALYDRAFT_317013 [Arabidopsis lyrata subsp. lyrata]
MLMRRALSSRNAVGFLRRSSVVVVQSRDFSIISSPNLMMVGRDLQFDMSMPDFLRDTRRGFAKGKKSKDDSGMVDAAPDIGPTVKAAASSQMEAAIDALSRDLTKLRTGRAAPGMLDHIVVETGGVKMPLNHLALVSVLDPKTLSVNPYDPDTVKELEKAIVASPLGLNPKLDGQRLVASIPADIFFGQALDTIKKAGSSLPKDEVKRLEKEVDELTKKFVKSAEDMCKSKEKEITEA